MPVVSPPSITPSAGHTHLLSHYNGINGISPNEQDSPTTIFSHQFDETQSLFEVAARLADGKDLLNDALTTITDNNATTKMTNIAIKVIRKSVLPPMDIASTVKALQKPPISNQLNKTTTVEHISSSNHHLKRHLEEQFAKFNSKLRIKKQSAIVDFLAKQPTILSRACVCEVRTSCLDM